MSLIKRVVSEGGYEFVEADLDFLGIETESFRRWSNRESPLTILRADYIELCSTLFESLEADGIHDADIRIQGSSVRFFSSSHKPMLYGATDLIAEFLDQYGRLPTLFERDRMVARLNSRWSSPGPTQRPFDSMFVIGAAREPSDIDFQVSSNDVRHVLERAARALGVNLSDLRSVNEKYNFFVKELTESEFTNVSIWRTRAMELVRRPVSIAMFGGEGPPEVLGTLSSHFKDDDWSVVR